MKPKSKVTRQRGKATDTGAIGGFSAVDIQALLASIARLPDDLGDDALDRAQEIAFDAMEAATPAARAALAREALAISAQCADAYLVLADDSKDDGEALSLYEQAVAAGAAALGDAAFTDDVGAFWGLIQTRPYMRARAALAAALWRAGKHRDAIGHYTEMLRLNPTDNQGIRYLLIDALLESGADANAAALLKRYVRDASAAWQWSRALLAFRLGGGRAATQRALGKAVDTNRHVADYLLGRKKLPRDLPTLIGFGDTTEAIAYVASAAAAWRAAPGAIEWLAASLATPATGKAATKAPATAATTGAAKTAKTGGGDQGQDPLANADLDLDRIDDATLALLLLGLHGERRAWKGFDWEALDRLHARGLISEPAGRAKAVVLSEAGFKAAVRLQRQLFAR